MNSMRRPIHLTFILCLVLSFVAAPFALAQSGDESKYFPQTGHNVTEPFIQFFNATGGIGRYGYPITEAYVDPQTKLLVQYFQRARLEWHPNNPDPYKIQLGLLGDELDKRTPPIPVPQIPSASDPNCQYFPETSHTACLKFMEHWQKTGGLDMYGYPITEYAIENGRIVQYFQRARMEWHPEKPAGQRIQLALLGQIYYDYAKLDRGRLEATVDSASPPTKPSVTALSARATVLNPIAPRNGAQTGMVQVSDQFGKPLSQAAVILVVHFPAGAQSFTLAPTNANGATSFSFGVGPDRPGSVVAMEFIVSYPGLPTIRTRTSYMVWFY